MTGGLDPHTQTYTYDVPGNMTSIKTDSDATQYFNPVTATNRLPAPTVYDASGNVTRWQDEAGATTEFEYDMFSQIQKKKASGTLSVYLYTVDGERFFAHGSTIGTSMIVRDFGGRPLREFTWREGEVVPIKTHIYMGGNLLGSEVEVQDAAGNYFFVKRHYSTDHLGSPRVITSDFPVQVVERDDFYPFGEEITRDDYKLPLKFTGHERDLQGTSGTGDDIDYMHARYASPFKGRFLSVDPLGGTPWAPQSFNRYSYVANNPMNWVDPFGMEAEEPVASFGAEITVTGSIPLVMFADETTLWDIWDDPFIWSQRKMTEKYYYDKGRGDTFALLFDHTALILLPESNSDAAFDVATGWAAGFLVRRAYRLFKYSKKANLLGNLLNGWCFAEGTLVWTEEGLIAIEDIVPGQEITCADPLTEEWSVCEVEELIVRDHQGELVAIVVEGEVIHATGAHPFWVVDGEALETRPLATDAGEDRWPQRGYGRWVEAKDVLGGDIVLLGDSRRVKVSSVSGMSASLKTYNLDVSRLSTFAVGTSGVLVHNGRCPGLLKNISNKILKEGRVDIDKFTNGRYKNWILEKDNAGHGGSVFKLKDSTKKGYWSIAEDGKVLRFKD